MKASKNFFSALFIICFLNISCNRNNKETDYGVSISAPKMIGTSAEVFSEEHISTLKKSNSLNFLLLNNFSSNSDSSYNFSFSPLGVLHSIYNIKDENYIELFNEKFDISDTTVLFNNILTIKKLISEIDSTIKIGNSITTNVSKEISISQKLEFPLVYEGILKTRRLTFNVNEKEKNLIEYFTIKGNFGVCNDKSYLAFDIAIGNGNYSLLLIQPKDIDIKHFSSNLSENDYKTIIESLVEQMITVSFPDISNNSVYPLTLPNISSDSTYKPKYLSINSEIKIIKPTPAELKMRKSNIDNQIQTSSKTEKFIYNNPFIYIIRGKSSNSILAMGIFNNK